MALRQLNMKSHPTPDGQVWVLTKCPWARHTQQHLGIYSMNMKATLKYRHGNVCFLFTSAYWHLSCPGAITLADSVFRTPRQEVTMLTAVHQGVAKTGQIHPHYVHMERALWLLTGMGWRVEKGLVCWSQSAADTAWMGDNKLTQCMSPTYALRLCSTPCQIRLTGPGWGALNQMSWLALKGHHTPHLWRVNTEMSSHKYK